MITTNSSNSFLPINNGTADSSASVGAGSNRSLSSQGNDFSATLRQYNSDAKPRSSNDARQSNAQAKDNYSGKKGSNSNSDSELKTSPEEYNTDYAAQDNSSSSSISSSGAEESSAATTAGNYLTVNPDGLNQALLQLQQQPAASTATTLLSSNETMPQLTGTITVGNQSLLNTAATPTTAAELQQKLSQDTGTVIHSLTVTGAADPKNIAADAKAAARQNASQNSNNTAQSNTAATNTSTSTLTANPSTAATTAKTENVIDSSSQKDLLKSLDTDLRTNSIRTVAQQNGTTSATTTAATTTAATTADTLKKTLTAETAADHSAQISNHSALMQNSLSAQHNSAELLGNLNGAAGQTLFNTAVDRVNAVEQILDMVKENLPLPAMSNATGLKLDFDAGSLGRIQMQLQENGDSIQVTISANSDSAQQELMNQRQELAKELRNLGYRELSLNINDQRQQQGNFSQQQNNRNQNSGNENAENVKLSGNSQDDLMQLLAVN